MNHLLNRPTISFLDTEYVDECDFITNDPILLNSLDVMES